MPKSPDPALLIAQTLAQRNNDSEAVYRAYLRKRALVKKLSSKRSKCVAKKLDDLAWTAAEHEARPVRAVGFFISP